MKTFSLIFVLSFLVVSFAWASSSDEAEKEALLLENGIRLKAGEEVVLFAPAASLRKNSPQSEFLQTKNDDKTCMARSEANTKLREIHFAAISETERQNLASVNQKNKEAILRVLSGKSEALNETIKGDYANYADFLRKSETSWSVDGNPLREAIQEFQKNYKILVNNEVNSGFQLIQSSNAASVASSTVDSLDWNPQPVADLLKGISGMTEDSKPFSLGMLPLSDSKTIKLSEEGHSISVVGYIKANGKISRLLVKDPNFPDQLKEISVNESQNELAYDFPREGGALVIPVAAGRINDFHSSKSRTTNLASNSRMTFPLDSQSAQTSSLISPFPTADRCSPYADELSGIFRAAKSPI